MKNQKSRRISIGIDEYFSQSSKRDRSYNQLIALLPIYYNTTLATRAGTLL